MEEYIKNIKAAFAAAVGLLTGLWGWLGWLVVGWIGCKILDYITGSAAAGKAGNWTSAQAREGIWHKAGMIVVVIVARMLAFTPEPSPSESAAMWRFSRSTVRKRTSSPQAAWPVLVNCAYSISMKRSSAIYPFR